MKHKLYVLEGVDASGKTTLAKLLAQNIGGAYYSTPPKHYEQASWDFESATPMERFEYYMGGNYAAKGELVKLLETGPVFIDRYVHSTVVCRSAEMGVNLAIPNDILMPDMIIYLKASWEDIEERLSSRPKRNTHENIKFLQRLAEKYKEYLADFDNIIHVDTTCRNPVIVVNDIISKIV
ncbi:MAG: deoxynucleoside kinase [Nanoarchaeota archaeon]|nr:deoxynucleoside kinase [Nanoarchaeota archaeon]